MPAATTAPGRADSRADLRMLAWVREELRLSLEQAHKALRRYLRESLNRAEGDIVDPAILRAARQALHQASGALELVGQAAAARVVAAAEAVVVRGIADGALVTPEAVGGIERGSFAVLDYLAHVLAGKRVSTLALFPQYRVLQELARAERIHPADLWALHWQWAPLPEEQGIEPAQVDPDTRAELEALMLALMRQPDRQTLARLSELSASLGAGTQADGSTLWKLAAAFFEAQAGAALRPDVYAKRVAPRLLALARAGKVAPALQEQLARDLVFFCAQAQPARASRPVPRLKVVHDAFGLGREPVQDYENPRLGRFDPMWVTQARRRIGAAREVWAAVGAGELHHLAALAEQFALVGDSLQRLLPGGAELASALAAAVRQPVDSDGPPAPAVAMEVATLLLVLEATLEAADLDQPEWPQRVSSIVRRLQRACQPGAADEAPEPWMGEVYRTVSDQRTALAVSQELRVALGEIEKQFDQFVRQPTQTDPLEAAQPGLRTVQGVFAMMGLEAAAAGVGALAQEASALERGTLDATSPHAQATFEAMAAKLGALGMLVEVLAVQPQAARTLLAFDPDTGELVATPAQEAAAASAAALTAAPAAPPAEPVAATASAEPAQRVAPVEADEPQEAAEPAGVAEPSSVTLELAGAEPVEPPAGGQSVQPDDTASLPVLELLLDAEEPGAPAELAPLPELAELPEPPDLPDLPVLTEAITRPVPIDEPGGVREGPRSGELAWDDEGDIGTLPVPMVEELGSDPFEAFEGLAAPGSAPPAEALKVIGPLTLEVSAFNRFLNDADETVRELSVRLAEWGVAPAGAPEGRCLELARLLETRATDIGQGELAQVAQALGTLLSRLGAVEPAIDEEPALLAAATEHLQRLLHLFAAGFYEPADSVLVQRLREHQPRAAAPAQVPAPAAPQPVDDPEPELFAVFAEEAEELLAELRRGLATWVRQPGQQQAAATCMRALHTLKGGARLAGAMRLGERAHRLESRLERVLPGGETGQAGALFVEVDDLYAAFDALRARLVPGARLAQPLAEPATEPAAALPIDTPAPASLPQEPLEDLQALQEPFEPSEPSEPSEPVEPMPLPEVGPQLEALEDAAAAAAMFGAGASGAPEISEAVELQQAPELAETAELADAIESSEPLEPLEPLELMTLPEAVELPKAVELAAPEPEPEPEPEPGPEPDALALEAPFVEWPEEQRPEPTGLAPAEQDSVFPELVWPEVSPAETWPLAAPAAPVAQPAVLAPDEPAVLPVTLAAPAPALPEPESREEAGQPPAPTEPPETTRSIVPMRAMVRVRAELMDRLFNQAGEVGAARSTIETEVVRLKGSMVDLADNLERLRRQLRDLESHSDARAPRPRPVSVGGEPQFDPLEMDRYTRFQELVRMMAESLDDIATIQRGLTLGVQGAEDGLAAQTQAARGLMDDLLRTRLVEFESIADRLHRVARQAARETGRQVRLELDGGSIELDRGVLDRMGAPFEHLVRNCIVHGIESPAQRGAAGKPALGLVRIALAQEGNEVLITVDDDGRGLDHAAIRARALATGLIGPDDEPDKAALAALVFSPGLSTARGVTELAGRGIGLDAVRAEVLALGGRIELTSVPQQGTQVRITLTLTTAITQAVLLRLGESTVAVPSTIVEIVRRVTPADLERACDTGTLPDGEAGGTLPFYWLGALLEGPARPSVVGRAPRVVVLRSASQRLALFVDDILGHQEVVVKNLGPQLARLPGLAGMTVLASGEMVPIYNPVALAAMHGLQARERQRVAAAEGGEPVVTSEPAGPLVLVVDDSLTVRKVTQRLLLREGYRTALAKDGLEALERIAEEKPAMVLSDLEMPRMDGFDLVRNLRADPRFADLPVVIITSRIAQKHRDHAVALGVDHYLGKPFVERELLELVARHTGFPVPR